ncbi:MAG: hypothetical protein U0Z53_14755 [Blastocatellia bacterium]
MSTGVFLIQDDGQLIEMNEQAYASEDLLQQLLARYPSLLAGEQIDKEAPRRWVLVSREMSVPSEEDGSGRWSVDHLFLDQDAVPTIVEVKRSTDTRIRREVVGQMLDYAANAVVYWPVETIRARFEARCQAENADPSQELGNLMGTDLDPEQFWQRAKTNLQAGKVRLIFVADEIPDELRRVVEFLNEQMDPAEVLAVEIKQYVGKGLKSLIPRVLGQTADAQRKKSGASRESRQWDEDSFLSDLECKKGGEEAVTARKIIAWSKEHFSRIFWGSGKQNSSFIPVLDCQGLSHFPIAIYRSGQAEIRFQYMNRPFDDPAKRLELLRRLNQIPGVSISEDSLSRRPSIALSALKDPASLNVFFEAIAWVIQTIKAAS